MQTLVLGLVAYVVVLWPLVAAARKVLGVRVGIVRALGAALVGWVVAGTIIRAFPALVLARPGVAIGLLIPLAGSALAVTLLVLFVAELAVPSGGPGLFARLSALRSRIARGRRYSRIMRIAIRHGLGSFLTGRRTAGPDGSAKLARSLRLALEEAGVTFVKLGQLLSTRADLLPPVYLRELSKLHDQVPPAPEDQVRALLREEIDVDTAFAHIDGKPLAAASIAQVYGARLRSGEAVVVKVQRPGIREQVERDIDIVRRLASVLSARTGWARSLGVEELAEGFAESLHDELDFRTEAGNIAAIAARPLDGVTLPTVHKALSTERVLVMRRLDGKPLSAASAPAGAGEKLARTFLRGLLDQVLLAGVFHADPHPGNVLLLEDGTLGLLDFGSVGRLDSSLRAGLQALLPAVDRGDPAGVRDGLLEIVDRPDELDEQRLERALGILLARHFGPGRSPGLDVFTGLFRVVAEHRLSVPAPIAAVFRALATMEGTLATLAPDFDLVAESRAFATERVGLSPAALHHTVADELTALLPVLRRLPRRVDRIGAALEEGRLSVNLRLFSDERDRDLVTGLMHEVLLALVGIATGLMAVLLLASTSGPQLIPGLTLNQVFGYNLLMISALAGLRLLFVVFRRSGRPSRSARRTR
ncbi:ABC1 kinase family protein [Amycolatopsis benzoatilytica]|uniref:ABC1 kinase family protein n=1 Tax=Amycolatopsis benzoatilytica TaxID=346045 RepID=UPI00048145D8|nr:AarF/UbiB family protein [Amycolatopsis benzoatilytica]